MAKAQDGQFSAKEAKLRFEAALRGSREVGPKPRKATGQKPNKTGRGRSRGSVAAKGGQRD